MSLDGRSGARERGWRAAVLRCVAAMWRDAGANPNLYNRNYLRRAAVVDALEPRQLLSAAPFISEFLASNSTGLVDEDFDHSDWLELYNPGEVDVNLNGYSLTDDPGVPTKWQFPAVSIPSGGFLTVFADSKDRRPTNGGKLHTNFNLSAGGGYLALVAPGGTTVLSQYNYPQQVADLSYGVPFSTTVTPLLGPSAPARTRVPTDGSLGTTWKDKDFDDATWTPGTTGVGYETEALGPPSGPGFTVRMVDTQGGTDGDIGNIGEATALLDGTAAAGAFTIAADVSASRARINLGDGGAFGGDLTLPNGLGGTSADNTAAGRQQYAIRATANLTIPAGQYTINVNSDDGFRLRIPGVVFTGRVNENLSGAVNPSPDDTLVFGAPRGPANTLATFTVPAAGLTTTLTLDAYEQGGGDEFELSLATGQQTAFSTQSFQLLSDGLFGWSVKDPSSAPPPNYRALIGTDTRAEMFGANRNNTAYVRVPFHVLDPGDFNAVRLQVKYDDGFVAYVNGTKIDGRNAPASPTWNSAATGNRPDADALKYQSFSIPADLLVEGTNVLAVQGLNLNNTSTDFLVYPEIQGMFTTVLGGETYFAAPTPSAPNGASAGNTLQFVQDTKFNHERGFYAAPFDLSITTDTPGATIRYTTDGSAPTATSGIAYAGPIHVAGTTTVRAAAFKPGYQPTNVDTQTFVFMADVVQQSPAGQAPGGFPAGSVNGQTFNYGMDPTIVNARPGLIDDIQTLPSVSIVMDPKDLFDPSTGIYTHASSHGRAWERPTSIEFLYPDGTHENIQSNAGIRIRGGFSRSGSNPKHAFHLYFRGDYGDPTFDHPIFGPGGADSFNQFDLRTAQNYSWSFQGDSRYVGIRDSFSRDTQLAMGWQAERGDFYNLYINGQFWGVYNTDERAEADYGASYFGGSKEDYDVVKVAPDQGYNIEATDGNLAAWDSLWQQALGDMTVAANYQKLLGNNPDGTRNPAYPVLLDADNLIDYMLVIYYGGNLDAPLSNFLSNQSPNNWFGVRNRVSNDRGFQFFAHDAEHTLLDVNQDRTGPAPGQPVGPANGWPLTTTSLSKSNPQWLFQLLMANGDFKQRFADRVQRAFVDPGGALTPAAVTARLGLRRDQIDRAVYGESARWGDSKHTPAYTHDNWQTEINRIIGSYAPARSAKVIDQFRARGWLPPVGATVPLAPTFSRQGGTVPAGFALTMANPNPAGTLYYTLDGTDPRAVGGGLANTALAYTGGNILINQTRTVRARVLVDGAGWSPAAEATFTLDSSVLHVTEVMYNPLPPPGSPYTSDDLEYVELYNAGTAPLVMTGMRFTAGITVDFAAGTTLGGGLRGVVVRNPAAFQSRYGTAVPILGTYSNQLSNGGEQVKLVGAGGQTIADFTYVDSWYSNTDGGGYALVVRNPLADPATLGSASAWRPGNDLGGKPGASDPGLNPGDVMINEVLANPAGGDDWIELHNTTGLPIPIGGWYLSDAAADLRKYKIPAGVTLPANGYLTFFAGSSFGAAGNPGVNTPFGLGADGDSVHLSSVDAAGNVGGYQVQEDFEASETGVTFGQYLNSAGQSRFTALLTPTPGAPNSGPRLGQPIAINELMYFPTAGQEFVELRNLTGQDVPLYDPANPQNAWKFTDGIAFTFPSGVTSPGSVIPAFGYALVVGGDPTQFRAQFNIPTSVPIYGPYTAADGSNVLSNSGERVALARPIGPADPLNGVVPYVEVDSVTYDITAPWPAAAHGSGPSLSRAAGVAFGDDPAVWFAGPAGGTPGAANVANTPPTLAPVADATVNEGDPFTAPGSFTDPDLDPAGSWVGFVDYGDGTGIQPLILSGRGFVLSHAYADNGTPGAPTVYTVTVTIRDNVAAAEVSTTAHVTVNNVAPALTLSGPAVAPLNGVYTLNFAGQDPGRDTINRWTINWGTGSPEVVTGNPAAVTHTYAAPGRYVITATARDEDGTFSAANAVTVDVTNVVGRRVFYNNSAYDGRNPAATAADVSAVAPDKVALLPGQAATFANVTSYTKGINGVLVEFAALPPAALTAADFGFRFGRTGDPSTWAAAPAPLAVTSLGGGTGVGARYAITWADGVMLNGWLQVTVKANANTGLLVPDAFYFGNLVGETAMGAASMLVDATDYAWVRANQGKPSALAGRFDFDRDGRVSVLDLMAPRQNLYRALPSLAAPLPAAAAFASATTVARAAMDDPTLLDRLRADGTVGL